MIDYTKRTKAVEKLFEIGEIKGDVKCMNFDKVIA